MWLVDWVLRLRWVILAAGVALVAGGVVVLRDLDANYSFWTLFVSDDPEVVRQRAYVAQWGEDDAVVSIALRAPAGKVTTAQGLRTLADLEARMAAVPGIVEVTSALTQVTVRGEGDELIIGPLAEGVPEDDAAAAAWARRALDNRLLAGTLLSENEATALVVGRIDAALRDAEQRNPVVRALDALAREVADSTPYETMVVGIPVAQWVYSDAMVQDLTVFTGISVLLLGVILVVMFRSVVGLLLPLMVVGAATVLTLATMVLTGQHIDMINTAIPTLMLVIGIADGVHMMSEYRARLAAGDGVRDAVRHTFVRLGSACFLTSLTTAVGFASLAVARIGTVRSFGIYAGIGILYAFVANLLVIPVGLYVTGSRLGVPVGGGAQARPDASRLRAGLMRLGEFVCRRPRLTLGGSLLAILAVSSGLGLVRIESRMFEEISDDDPVVRAHLALEEDLPGILAYALDVTTAPGEVLRPELLRRLDELAALAEAHPAVDRALGLPHLLREMNRATHGGEPAHDRVPEDPELIAQLVLLAEGEATERILDETHGRTQVWMRGPEVVTSLWEDLRARLEAEVARDSAGARIVVTGASSMAQRALGSIIRDVMSSLLGASLIIFAIMSALFRSARVGLVSMVPNLLPLAATVGMMGWLGIHLRTSTVVIFSISLGLAVDDTIHFMVRYGRLRRGGLDAREAILGSFAEAGRPIVYTSVLLVGGFWVLLLSQFNATRDIGLLGGITLISALIADLVVLPALLRLWPKVGAGATTRPAPAPVETAGNA